MWVHSVVLSGTWTRQAGHLRRQAIVGFGSAVLNEPFESLDQSTLTQFDPMIYRGRAVTVGPYEFVPVYRKYPRGQLGSIQVYAAPPANSEAGCFVAMTKVGAILSQKYGKFDFPPMKYPPHTPLASTTKTNSVLTVPSNADYTTWVTGISAPTSNMLLVAWSTNQGKFEPTQAGLSGPCVLMVVYDSNTLRLTPPR